MNGKWGLLIMVMTGLLLAGCSRELILIQQTTNSTSSNVSVNSSLYFAGNGLLLNGSNFFSLNSSYTNLLYLLRGGDASSGSYNFTSANGIVYVNPDSRVWVVQYNGSANAAQIINNGTGTSNNALNVVSSNPNDSTLGVNGVEVNRGTVKVVHTGNGTDGSASAISIQLAGNGTASQGIYLNIGNSSGNPLLITNGTYSFLTVDSLGKETIASNSTDCFLVQNLAGTDMFKVSCGSSIIFVKKTIPISTHTYSLGDPTHVWKNLTVDDIIAANLTGNLNASYIVNPYWALPGSVNCSAGNVLFNVTVNSSGVFGGCVAQTGGGGGSTNAANQSTAIQFNGNGTSFGGDSHFRYNTSQREYVHDDFVFMAPNAPSDPQAIYTPNPSNYIENGEYGYQWTVYAYKTYMGVKRYSPVGIIVQGSTIGAFDDSQFTFNLNWSPVSGADGYVINYDFGDDGIVSVPAHWDVGANTSNIDDGNLSGQWKSGYQDVSNSSVYVNASDYISGNNFTLAYHGTTYFFGNASGIYTYFPIIATSISASTVSATTISGTTINAGTVTASSQVSGGTLQTTAGSIVSTSTQLLFTINGITPFNITNNAFRFGSGGDAVPGSTAIGPLTKTYAANSVSIGYSNVAGNNTFMDSVTGVGSNQKCFFRGMTCVGENAYGNSLGALVFADSYVGNDSDYAVALRWGNVYNNATYGYANGLYTVANNTRSGVEGSGINSSTGRLFNNMPDSMCWGFNNNTCQVLFNKTVQNFTNIFTTSLTMSGNLLPLTNNSIDIGNNTLRIRNISAINVITKNLTTGDIIFSNGMYMREPDSASVCLYNTSDSSVWCMNNTVLQMGNMVISSGTPSITAGAGLGTSPSVGISGTDHSGLINVSTGTLPSVSATVLSVKYSRTYPSTTYIILTPANANAALLTGTSGLFASANTTGFSFTSGSVALTGSTTYLWYYEVTN